MPWDVRNSNSDLRRDIERWTADLAMLEAAGFANSSATKTIRDWIAEVERLIA
jgi:hypothetical protein